MKKNENAKNRIALERERERERATLLENKKNCNKNKAENKLISEETEKEAKNKINIKDKIHITPSIAMPFVLLAMLLVCFIVLKNNSNVIEYTQAKQQLEAQEKAAQERIEEIGQKGYISDATIISTKTGTGPFDDNDDAGNDSSEDNNIVRSFDQVTWTIDLTTKLKEGVTDTSLTGGAIEIEATLPEACADVMKWDLDSMLWLEEGQVTADGRTVTGKYTMSETETTIPGKQTLVFVLQVYGAGNRTEIIPTFNFKLIGNEDSDKKTITGETITVSATGKFNIQLNRNVNLANKITVDYGKGETSGRIYGYGFTVQLYNDDESKGLKGLEYPEGEISFDIDLKLERSRFNSDELEDITDECTPILWQYRTNDWTDNTVGFIEDRELYGTQSYQKFDGNIPLGKYMSDDSKNETSDYSVYNSGNIKIQQENNKLKVTINNYGFNGIFPYYNSDVRNSSIRGKIYTDNIGTFSVGYMQIFVPDNTASTIEDRNYYLTVSDNNMNISLTTTGNVTTQIKTNDDIIKVQHIIYKPGGYNDAIELVDDLGHYISSIYSAGDGKALIGEKIVIQSKFAMDITGDTDIYAANRFIKFDGKALEPRYYDDGTRYKLVSFKGTAKFRIWYVTKKDGTNWTSENERNNANIEDMDIYDNIEDIPENKICIGVYAETIDGYISKDTGWWNFLNIPVKVKNTAIIGNTYGITQRTRLWREKLDRNIYTITNNIIDYINDWPAATWTQEIEIT